jgi:hypothetical protein
MMQPYNVSLCVCDVQWGTLCFFVTGETLDSKCKSASLTLRRLFTDGRNNIHLNIYIQVLDIIGMEVEWFYSRKRNVSGSR